MVTVAKNALAFFLKVAACVEIYNFLLGQGVLAVVSRYVIKTVVVKTITSYVAPYVPTGGISGLISLLTNQTAAKPEL
jgi:hypothetical protein